MGLFKSGKAKADDLLTILVPALQREVEEEIRIRLLREMEDIVLQAAQQVISYTYSPVINELTVKVVTPKKEWVGLTDEQKKEATAICKAYCHSWAVDPIALCNYVEAKLKEKNT